MPSSPAIPAPAPSCSSASTRTCCRRSRASCPSRCMWSCRARHCGSSHSVCTTSWPTTGSCSAGSPQRSMAPCRTAIRSPCRNATSAAGGRTAIGSGARTTTSASSPASQSCRSRSCAGRASRRWRRWRSYRANTDPRAVRRRLTCAYANRPASSSRAGAQARRATRRWRWSKVRACAAFPSLRQATSFWTSKGILSLARPGSNICSVGPRVRRTGLGTIRAGHSIRPPSGRPSSPSSIW